MLLRCTQLPVGALKFVVYICCSILIIRRTGEKECLRVRRPVVPKERQSAQFLVEGLGIKTLTVKIEVIAAKKE